MCYGHLDPKHQMREIEARVKHLSLGQDQTNQAAPVAPGLWARLRDLVQGLPAKDKLAKDKAHV